MMWFLVHTHYWTFWATFVITFIFCKQPVQLRHLQPPKLHTNIKLTTFQVCIFLENFKYKFKFSVYFLYNLQCKKKHLNNDPVLTLSKHFSLWKWMRLKRCSYLARKHFFKFSRTPYTLNTIITLLEMPARFCRWAF